MPVTGRPMGEPSCDSWRSRGRRTCAGEKSASALSRLYSFADVARNPSRFPLRRALSRLHPPEERRGADRQHTTTFSAVNSLGTANSGPPSAAFQTPAHDAAGEMDDVGAAGAAGLRERPDPSACRTGRSARPSCPSAAQPDRNATAARSANPARGRAEFGEFANVDQGAAADGESASQVVESDRLRRTAVGTEAEQFGEHALPPRFIRPCRLRLRIAYRRRARGWRTSPTALRPCRSPCPASRGPRRCVAPCATAALTWKATQSSQRTATEMPSAISSFVLVSSALGASAACAMRRKRLHHVGRAAAQILQVRRTALRGFGPVLDHVVHLSVSVGGSEFRLSARASAVVAQPDVDRGDDQHGERGR